MRNLGESNVNHKMRASFLAAAVLFLLASWVGAAEVNLLPNGGFELSGRMTAKWLNWRPRGA